MCNNSRSEQIKHDIAELIKKYSSEDMPIDTIGRLSLMNAEQTEQVLHNIAELIKQYSTKENG